MEGKVHVVSEEEYANLNEGGETA
jgi:hypothetical protein